MRNSIIKYLLCLSIYICFLFIIFRTHNLIVADQSVKEIEQTNKKIWLDIKITNDLSKDLEIFGMENLKKDKKIPIKKIKEKKLKEVRPNLHYRLQLASIRKKTYDPKIKNEIKFENKEIELKIGNLIDSEVNIPGLGFFIRIQTKKLFSKNEAKLICDIILKEKKPCLILKAT